MHRDIKRSRWLDPGPAEWADPEASFFAVAMGRFLALVAVAVVAILVGGCAGGGGGSAGGGDRVENAGDLVGTIWRIEHIDAAGAGQVPLKEPGKYVLQLQPGGRLGVRADCVTCVGAYDLSSRVLQMQLDCPSIVGCGPESHADLFLGSLEQVRTYDVAGGKLRLYNLDNSGVITMERVLRHDTAQSD